MPATLPMPVRLSPSIEILVPVMCLPQEDVFTTVKDLATAEPVRVPTAGHVLLGTLLCARLTAFDVEGDHFLVRTAADLVAVVEAAEGSPLKVAV